MPSSSASCRARAAEVLRSGARLFHDLTQILRLCVTGKFNPKTAGEDLLRVMARAGDAPDFSALEARIKETQTEVRRVFKAVVEGGYRTPACIGGAPHPRRRTKIINHKVARRHDRRYLAGPRVARVCLRRRIAS